MNAFLHQYNGITMHMRDRAATGTGDGGGHPLRNHLKRCINVFGVK
jgi:hypothetical protein